MKRLLGQVGYAVAVIFLVWLVLGSIIGWFLPTP